jgi:hypothetical protein
MLDFFVHKIINLIKWSIWVCKGFPYITYYEYTCACCKKQIKETKKIRQYESINKYVDTWKLCPDCRGKWIELPSNGPSRVVPMSKELIDD